MMYQPTSKFPLSIMWCAAFIAALLLAFSSYSIREEYREEGEKTAIGLARLWSEHVSGSLQASELSLSLLLRQAAPLLVAPAENVVSRRVLRADMASSLGRIRGVSSLLLADVSGRTVLGIGQDVPPNLPLLAFRDRLKQSSSSVTLLSEVYARQDGLQKYVLLAKPLFGPEGNFIGSLSAVIDLEQLFSAFYANLNLPTKSWVSLYNEDFLLLARTQQQGGQPLIGHIPLTAEVHELLKQPDDHAVQAVSAVDHLNRIFAVHTVPGFPLRIVSSLAEEQYMSAAALYTRMALAGGVLLGVFALVVTILLARRQAGIAESYALLKAAQDSLMAHVAVVDPQGVIVAVNDRWIEFAQDNAKEFGIDDPHTGVGMNYLAVCQASNDECSGSGAEIQQGIRDVLAGRLPSFQTVYPCHSPTERRWFQMMVAPLKTARGGAVVSHTNITRLILAEEALRESEQHYRTLADSGIALVWTSGLDMRCDYFNEPWLRFRGRTLAEEIGEGWLEGVHPDDREMCFDIYVAAFQQRQAFSMDYRLRRADGEYRWIQDAGTPRYDSQQNFIGYIGHCLDITERKQAEEEMRKLTQAVAQSPDAILITDDQGTIEFVNEAFTQITGFTSEEVLGHNPRMLRAEGASPETYATLWSTIAQGLIWHGELQNRRKDGSEYLENVTISPVRDAAGRITHYVSIQRDVTEIRRVQAENQRLARYDLLTNLPNRTLLLERVERALSVVHQRQYQYALLIINLDRFKTYNDGRGHEQGDLLLMAFAQRLSSVFKQAELLARLGGDEFAVLLQEESHSQDALIHEAAKAADSVHVCLLPPLEVQGEAVLVTASIGVALLNDQPVNSPLEILRQADTALHRAKASGGHQTAFFEAKMDALVQERFQVERDLRVGIAAGQLRLYLQPQVTANGEMVGSEALVRWQHPERGFIAPNQFISVAEESDLIVQLDTWVLEEVCRMLAQPALAEQPLRISVNISPRHFRKPGFVASLQQLLARYGTNPRQLTLEITEGLVIENMEDVIGKMHVLADLGVHFSLDDFGTGYSSLAYLKRLPLHEIKIDKAFVQDAPRDSGDGALVETILSVAKHMHLKVVAEGVETQEQADFLNSRAAVIHQGFLFARPEPAEQWLQRIHLAETGH